MKLIVTIPAYNEEKSIGGVIRDIPRRIKDVDLVQVFVVDDGSSDNTIGEAKRAGADRIIPLKNNRGLAYAFKKGMDTALDAGADVIVNIDADNQYDAGEIPALIEPILAGEADIVLGSRFKGWIENMPLQKRIGNRIATRITSFASGFPISDAQTGFRAFSRDAVLHLNILSEYTYVQETIIQAINKDMVIKDVPVHFRKRSGRSRLIPNILVYARRAGITILQTYLHHKPLGTFIAIGSLLISIGLVIGSRVIIHFVKTGLVTPYIPSTILSSIFLIIGFQIIVLGLMADLIAKNRRLLDEILYKLRKNA